MRKFISTLVLMTFALVTQVPFLHALDMNMDTMTMSAME